MRYSLIHHDVRQEFNLTVGEYLVCDAIHQLSHTSPTFKSNREISRFLGIDEITVRRSKTKLLTLGLAVEIAGWKTTEKWSEAIFAAREVRQNVATPRQNVAEGATKCTDTIINIYKHSANALEIVDDSKRQTKPREDTSPYEKILKWAESRTGRTFIGRVKQYSALKRAKEAGVSITALKERWIELEDKPFHKENGLDWNMVVSSFDRK